MAEIPLLDVVTQAHAKREILAMVKDAIETLVGDKTFSVRVTMHENVVCIDSSETKHLIALILKRQRRKRKLTLEDVSEKLHAKSINEYAQYEQGKHLPSFEKFEQLLNAIDPKLAPVISCM